eukprot:COSAG02_NODE_1712_length_11221_cov_93.698346_2_plen_246_part_00
MGLARLGTLPMGRAVRRRSRASARALPRAPPPARSISDGRHNSVCLSVSRVRRGLSDPAPTIGHAAEPLLILVCKQKHSLESRKKPIVIGSAPLVVGIQYYSGIRILIPEVRIHKNSPNGRELHGRPRSAAPGRERLRLIDPAFPSVISGGRKTRRRSEKGGGGSGLGLLIWCPGHCAATRACLLRRDSRGRAVGGLGQQRRRGEHPLSLQVGLCCCRPSLRAAGAASASPRFWPGLGVCVRGCR